MAEASVEKREKPGWGTLFRSLRNRKSGYMALFGFASGLPFALFLGTLYAWLSEAEVDLETMGVFSLIGLAYAFQFLWSPLVDKLDIPLLRRLGKRKQWIAPAQLLLGAILVTMSLLNPATSLGMFSLLAAIGAFTSATQDIAINAWRIDVADEDAPLDILSTIYQMGFRLSSLVGGAVGLMIAARIGWPMTYVIMGGLMLAIGFAGLFAPDADANDSAATKTAANESELVALYQPGEIVPRVRNWALLAVALLWGWAIGTVVLFMVRSMTSAPELRPNPTDFTLTYGPLIVLATIVLPAIIAAWLSRLKRRGMYVLADTGETPAVRGGAMTDHLYRALVMPLVEFVSRMGWSIGLVLALVLTYRITDSIWGTFAYPFYLGELQYTNDEVAVASKLFGVGATVLGLAFGGYLITVFGRMFMLTLGAILAASTNLLYADLALGGANMQRVSDLVGFTALVETFGGSERLARLMITIGFENLATGIASAAYVAWLSSIVAKGYSAVQYALLASLTLLIGALGRGALGEMIEDRGYHYVFIFTALIGVVAVALCMLEWMREKRWGSLSGVVAPDPAAVPAE